MSDTAPLAERLAGLMSKRPVDRLGDAPPRALAWLAMSCGWPASLAAQGFPGHDRLLQKEQAIAVLDALVAATLAEIQQGERPWAEPWYVMNRQQRALVICDLAERYASDGDLFLRCLNEAAGAMSLLLGDRSAPPQILRWVRLGLEGSVDAIAARLDRAVEAAIDAAWEKEQTTCPEALRWIETAEPLAQALAANLEVALARAKRRLELFHRRSRDARLLKNYQPRQAQEQAFLDLLPPADPAAKEDPATPWALHFIGYGGAGKTMLLRSLKSRLATTHNLTTARIDFDTLNPNYPTRSPGLLLMGFAEELRLSDDAYASALFARFDRMMLALHARLENAFQVGTRIFSGGAARLDTNYADAESGFISALTSIAHMSRPVLILDTCEELAKARTSWNLPQSLLTTFDILERLHDAVPRLRVIFSGRRMLAGAGYGWALPGVDLPPRPYLKLMELRGFDRDEAAACIAGYHVEGRHVPPDLAGAVLNAAIAKETRITASVIWTPPLSLPDRDDRYNPYDVALFADLACSEPPPRASDLADGHEAFVRERIINRLTDDVGAILAELTNLGRFDRALLETLLGRRDVAFDPVWDDLKGQEWTDIDRTARPGAEILVMEPHIRSRLRRHLKSADPAAWSAARRRLSPLLRDVTLSRRWDELVPFYFAEALDILADTPAEAAKWWGQVDLRFAQDGVWPWARDITALLSDDFRLADGSLRAAVFATRAAASLRLAPEDLTYAWTQVGEFAARHPMPDRRAVLRYRAAAGLMTAMRLQPDRVIEDNFREFETALAEVPPLETLPPAARNDPQVWGSEIGFLESAADILERIDWQDLPPASAFQTLIERTERLQTFLADTLLTYAGVLRARFAQFADHLGPVALPVPDDDVLPPSTGFLDWLSPDNFASRIRLEIARLNRPFLRGDAAAIRLPKTLDEDRLAAIQLLAAADQRPVTLDLRPAIDASLSLAHQPPACFAHSAIPPLFVVALEQLAQSDLLRPGFAELQSIAADQSMSLEMCQAAQRAVTRLAMRYRIAVGPGFDHGVLRSSVKLADAVLVAGQEAFDPKHAGTPYRGRWREAAESLDEQGQDLQLELTMASMEPQASFTSFSLALDEEETAGVKAEKVIAWLARHTRLWMECAWLCARAGMVPPEALTASTIDESLLTEIPYTGRRAAELLFEEASLLSLRAPAEGAARLETAARLYHHVQDRVGAFISATAACLAWARIGERSRLEQAKIELPDMPLQTDRGGWLLRYDMVRCRIAEFDAPGPLTTALMQSPAYLDAVAKGIPLDMQGVLAGRTSETALKKSLLDGRKDFGLWAFVIVWMCGAVLGIGLAMQHGARLFGARPNLFVSTLSGVLLVGVLASLVGRVPPVLAALRQQLQKWLPVSSRLSPLGPVGDPNRPLKDAGTLFENGLILRLNSLAPPRVERLPSTTAETYLDQSRALLGAGRWLTTPPIPFPFPFPLLTPLNAHLAIDPRCAASCWEALLGLRGGRTTRMARLPFMFRRTGISPSSDAATDFAGRVVVRLWAAGRATKARSVWARQLSSKKDHRFDVQSSADAPWSLPADVLHVMCEVVETAGGLFLHLDRADPDKTAYDSAISPGLSLADLVLGPGGPPRLCVLQGLILPESRRLPSDRHAAGLMRRAAAELFELGVPAVLVIPCVTEALAAEVIEPLAAAVAEASSHGTEALLFATRKIQLAIAAGTNNADTLEIAFDVCLYCVANLALSTKASTPVGEAKTHGSDEIPQGTVAS